MSDTAVAPAPAAEPVAEVVAAPQADNPKRRKAVEIPDFVKNRIAMWDAIYPQRLQEAKTADKKIEVTLPDGRKMEAVAGVTTPLDLAKQISQNLAQNAVVAKVNTTMWDLFRPLEEDCTLQLYTFDSKEGSYTFWHSSAHVLGQALELQFKDARLCIGPPVEDGGFYYDVHLTDKKIAQSDYKDIENVVEKVIKEKQPFQRLVLKKEEALEMFKENPFKQEIIKSKVPDGGVCTAYRCGPLVDLCKGPHLPDTGRIRAMAVTKNSSSYWLGKADNASLQRVYGISFPDKALMKEWKDFVKKAEERDHRKLGPAQKLFFFHQLSPGSCFFMPHGTRIYNTLITFIRNEYWKRGYSEVVTPNVFNIDLWKTSGHYENYKENMFTFNVEGQEFGMKPMNCPGHCVMFSYDLHSYRHLPIRMADFGVLHRNEMSGALTGLTRVRRFQQDDAHIFCRPDQIEQEVAGVLDMLKHVYGIFGFEFNLCLSTRPAKFLGEVAQWDNAEKALAACLDKFGKKWDVNPGDGAFYGPKIDIQLTDALKRKHQCATIQLDFQLPIRFDLSYKNEEGKFERPVIVHRAILGSVERMIAVLIEHTGGKWPFWLSPRQVSILTVSEKHNEYAHHIREMLHRAGYFVDVDDSNDKLTKKIREAQVAQYNFILVVGDTEVGKNTVNIRFRDEPTRQEEVSQEGMLEFFAKVKAAFQ